MLPGVAFTPSSEQPWCHSLAIVLAGLPGGVALGCAAGCIWRERTRLPAEAALTVAMATSALGVGALWTATFVSTWPDAWILPTAQRVAWVALLAWALAAARCAGCRP